MRKSINIALSTILLAAAGLHAQQTVVQQPDCVIFFHFTAAGQTSPTAPNAGFSNLTNGCTTWNVSYANTGFSVLSLTFQSAPNVSGAPGSWSTFASPTILSGINPNTSITGAFTWLTGYNPWVRMTLASATGSGQVDGAVYGYRIPSAGNTGSSGPASNVNVSQVGGTNTSTGNGTTDAGTLRVSVSSDSTGQIKETNFPATVDTNTGNAGVSTPRVVIATNQPNLTTPLNVTDSNFPATVDTNTGNAGASTLRTVIATNQPNLTTPLNVQLFPGTGGGLTAFTLQPTASDNHTVIKNGAGVVYHINSFNNSATVNYIRLYNAGTGFNGCNSATGLVWQNHIPGLTSDAGFVEELGEGIAFSTGISICVTSGYANTDTTNATATAITVNIGYK